MIEDNVATSPVRKESGSSVTEVPAARFASGGDSWATDARLQAAVDHVARGDCEVLSLDPFDTLMWRKLPEPASRPHLLGARLAAEGLLAPELDGDAFAALCERGERLARKDGQAAGRGTEGTLRDACARIPPYALRGITLDDLIDQEVELERTLLVPDLDVVELVRWAGERGVRLVCVSDTHFSEPQLCSFLAAFPTAALQVERVFTSYSRGVGTREGLWRVVLEEIGVRADGVVHVGADPDCDGAASGQGEVRTVHFERHPESLARMVRAEEQHAVDPLSPYHGDYGLTALRSKVLNRVVCREQPSELRPFYVFGAASLGPPLAGFAEWVVQRADEAGTRSVLCTMPAGPLMAQLVNAAASSVGSPVEAEPIPLSPHVCARASGSAKLRGRIVQQLERARAGGEDRLVLVNVGRGACQPLLNGLRRTSGSKLRTSELSLIGSGPAAEPVPGSVGFLAGPGYPPASVEPLSRAAEVLGRICMPERGSPVGLDSSLEPVPAPLEEAPMQWARRETVRTGIAAFQREWLRYRTSVPNALVPLHEYGQDRLRSILIGALSSASAGEAGPVAEWLQDEELRTSGLEYRVSPASARRGVLTEARRVARAVLRRNDRSQ